MNKVITTYKSIAYLWYNNKVVGYSNTFNEADKICSLDNRLSWSYPKSQLVKNYSLVNIHNYKNIIFNE